MAYTIVPIPFQIYQNVTMTVLVQGQSSRLILTKTWWNIDNLAIIFVICNLGNKSFPLVSVHDIDLQLWPSSRSNFENIDDWLTISISHWSISSSIFNWFSCQSPARQYQEVPYEEINYGPAKCGCPIVIGLSVRPVRKKWLSPFYTTKVWYIHQTCTNCSSWHDLLIQCGGLCPWPTFHAWVTMVRKNWLSL